MGKKNRCCTAFLVIAYAGFIMSVAIPLVQRLRCKAHDTSGRTLQVALGVCNKPVALSALLLTKKLVLQRKIANAPSNLSAKVAGNQECHKEYAGIHAVCR